jgi:hypothetical protein
MHKDEEEHVVVAASLTQEQSNMKRVSHSIIISILFCNLKACGVSFYSGAIITPPRAKCKTGKLALRCETDIKFISPRCGSLATSVTLGVKSPKITAENRKRGGWCFMCSLQQKV